MCVCILQPFCIVNWLSITFTEVMLGRHWSVNFSWSLAKCVHPNFFSIFCTKFCTLWVSTIRWSSFLFQSVQKLPFSSINFKWITTVHCFVHKYCFCLHSFNFAISSTQTFAIWELKPLRIASYFEYHNFTTRLRRLLCIVAILFKLKKTLTRNATLKLPTVLQLSPRRDES